jgi:hypothetical protein
MSVVCTNTRGCPYLTLGKKYEPKVEFMKKVDLYDFNNDEVALFYTMRNDVDRIGDYRKEDFISVEELREMRLKEIGIV